MPAAWERAATQIGIVGGRIIRLFGFQARFFLRGKFGAPREVRPLRLNGGDGFLIVERDGGLQTWSIDWNAKGEVQTIYAVRNPDKLEHLRPAFSGLAG